MPGDSIKLKPLQVKSIAANIAFVSCTSLSLVEVNGSIILVRDNRHLYLGYCVLETRDGWVLNAPCGCGHCPPRGGHYQCEVPPPILLQAESRGLIEAVFSDRWVWRLVI